MPQKALNRGEVGWLREGVGFKDFYGTDKFQTCPYGELGFFIKMGFRYFDSTHKRHYY